MVFTKDVPVIPDYRLGMTGTRIRECVGQLPHDESVRRFISPGLWPESFTRRATDVG
jgi:hypothetical protein